MYFLLVFQGFSKFSAKSKFFMGSGDFSGKSGVFIGRDILLKFCLAAGEVEG